MITFSKYVKAESLDEAYTLNQVKKNKIIGGMLWLRLGAANYNTLIDISGLGLDKIEEDENQIKIGAMVSLRELEKNELINKYTNNAVSEALKDIVGVQFRNMATVGGSIWGRFGFSDVLTVLLSLDCYVELYKGGIVPLEEFSKTPYIRDILMNVIIKKRNYKCVYDSVRIQQTDFPVLTCAASLTDDTYKVVIGARPTKARVYYDEDNILSELSFENIHTFADKLTTKVPTASNNRGSSTYRSHLVGVLTERNLSKLGEII